MGRVIPRRPIVAYAAPLPISAERPLSIPVREIAPWALFAFALAAVVVYFVGFEQGTLAIFSSDYMHEFVHDARHLAGLPCH